MTRDRRSGAALAAGHAIEQARAILGQPVAAPGDVLIGTDESEVTLIKIACRNAGQGETGQRQAALDGSLLQRACLGSAAAQIEQGEAAAEPIEQRHAVAEPEMRRPAAGAGARAIDIG